MRRKIAIIILLAMIIQLLPVRGFIDYSHANIAPSIFSVEIEQIVRVVDNEKAHSYRVIFNGYNVRAIQSIFVKKDESTIRNIPASSLRLVDDSTLVAEDITTLTSFFGQVLGDTIQLIPIYRQDGEEGLEGTSNDFVIPDENLPDINRIHDGTDWVNPPSWPASVIKADEEHEGAEDHKFKLEGTNFGGLKGYSFWLQEGSAPASKLQIDGENEEKDYRIEGNILEANTSSSRVPIGRGMRIIFEKESKNVTIRYRLENALNIIKELYLGDTEEIEISPLEGTQGTLVRIKVPEYRELIDPQTRVYIGGVEAKRNIITAEGRDGTFTYDDNGLTKKGLEIIVPKLDAGKKQIIIQNYLGDTYIHGELFEYYEAGHPQLRVGSIIPDQGPVGRRNTIDTINLRNAVDIHNFKEVTSDSKIKSVKPVIADDIKYKGFKEEDKNDSNLLFLQYELEDGRYIERMISLTIGLPAKIEGIRGLPSLPNGDGEEGVALPESNDISAETAAVGTPGKALVRVRMETVLFDGDQPDKDIEYIVEQAPYTAEESVYYEFIADETIPVITHIIPNQGRYDKDMVVTIEGQNFDVRHIDGKTYYPTITIGKNEQYKTINDKGAFFSKTSDGNYDSTDNANIFYRRNEDGDIEDGQGNTLDDNGNLIDSGGNIIDRGRSYIQMTILDRNGNVVDGQLRKKGSQIKLTIPGDTINDFYTGAADIIIRNPTARGELGTMGSRDNFFEYLPKTNINPEITSVEPDKVAVASREIITVRGRNFKANLIVSVDGEIIPNPNINAAAGTIQFNAPEGRPGKSFIQLISPDDGGIASAPFEFIRTYSVPRIDRIIPNEAGEGALVIIKGSGFYKADKQGETTEAKKGSTILIDGKDVNKEYSNIQEDPKEKFIHPITGDEIKDVNGKSIPTYGSNIAVVDDKTIYMIVPDPKDRDKPFFMNEWLDVEVVNPDLGKHTLTRGFKFVDVAKWPKIDTISPTLGDYRGGNIVQIDGRDFVEGAKVYFGTEEAQVYRRSNLGQTLWVFVPPYPNQLGDKNQAIVPVTIVNPDSGADTKYEGYTYVNPGYTPSIREINPNSGNTAGGDRVLISGENFRTVVGEVYDENEWKPDVYFAGIKVEPEDVTFVLSPTDKEEGRKTTDLLVVENTPANPQGRVDVTVINYDGATATLKNGYQYISRRPTISRILPNQGTVLGGTEITIIGGDFVEKGLHVAFDNDVGKQDILSGQARVKVGDIIVHYDAYGSGDNINVYYKSFNEADPEENLLGSLNLTDDDFGFIDIDWKEIAQEWDEEDKANLADEKIKIEIKGKELIVTRRLAFIQRVEGMERIVLVTPPGVSVGRTKLTVYNHDGTNVSGDYTYTSPYRPPVITEIIPTTDVEVVDVEGMAKDISLAVSSPDGGSPLIITGKNFRAGVKVFIGDREAEIRSRSLGDDELIITVPPAASGTVGQYLRILVTNEDGGLTYGDMVPEGSSRRPYYFQYIVEGSSPSISLVDPNIGPVSGGTKVVIKGKEFKDEDSLGSKKEVRVFVGGIPVSQSHVKYIDYNNLEITVPRGKLGTQAVEVVNYDYGRAIGSDGFTYISEPKILSVNPAKIFTNDTETEITITGKMFMSGAKVILGGEVIREENIGPGMEVMGTGISGVENGINKKTAVVGGVEATHVNVVDEETIKVRFPEAFDLDHSKIIIVNPDGGISDEYDDFKHEIPIPTKPLVLEAIPGYESTVQLIWSDSEADLLNAAEKYEIYGKESRDRNYSFLGDTEGAEFLVKGLEPSSRYDFMVRALNRYGSALEFAEVTVRTLSPREDEKLKDKLEELEKIEDQLKKEGQEERIDGALVKTIGTQQIPSSASSYTLDFSLSKYRGQNKFIVAIPVSIMPSLDKTLTITDGQTSFSFNPRNLYTREVIQGSAGNREDAYARVVFEKMAGSQAEGLYSAIDRTHQRASAIYNIDFELQVGTNITGIRQLLRGGSLLMGLDARSYPNIDRDSLFIGKYNPANHSFESQGRGGMATVGEPAKYILVARRR